MAQRTQLKQIIELGVSQRQANDHLVHDAVVALAQEAARSRVQGSVPGALTDSSGGTAGAVLAAVVTPTVALVDGVTALSPKAGFDTATGLIQDAHKELATTVNLFLARINGTTGGRVTMTNGAAADAIIAAITSALTASATNTLEAASGKVQISRARNVQAALASAINYCRVAMGLAPITDGSGGLFKRDVNGWNVDADVRALSGASPANGAESLTDASVDAALNALRNNISTLSATMNAMRAVQAIGPFVVATSNPRTRLAGADVTP